MIIQLGSTEQSIQLTVVSVRSSTVVTAGSTVLYCDDRCHSLVVGPYRADRQSGSDRLPSSDALRQLSSSSSQGLLRLAVTAWRSAAGGPRVPPRRAARGTLSHSPGRLRVDWTPVSPRAARPRAAPGRRLGLDSRLAAGRAGSATVLRTQEAQSESERRRRVRRIGSDCQ